MSGQGDRWSLLLPVKRLDLAKTRLAVTPSIRVELALAMACDTASAALQCELVGEVLVITDDARATKVLADLGARVVPDQPDAGLNAALRFGADSAACGLVVSVASDLPALQAADLTATLTLAADRSRSVVADAAGTGTTLLAGQDADHFTPAFGLNSLAAHVAGGATDLTGAAAASIRHDVDNLAALAIALELGVGPRTRQVLIAMGIDRS